MFLNIFEIRKNDVLLKNSSDDYENIIIYSIKFYVKMFISIFLFKQFAIISLMWRKCNKHLRSRAYLYLLHIYLLFLYFMTIIVSLKETFNITSRSTTPSQFTVKSKFGALNRAFSESFSCCLINECIFDENS